jgi:hypothetical protein
VRIESGSWRDVSEPDAADAKVMLDFEIVLRSLIHILNPSHSLHTLHPFTSPVFIGRLALSSVGRGARKDTQSGNLTHIVSMPAFANGIVSRGTRIAGD